MVTEPPLFTPEEVSQRAQDNATFLMLSNIVVLRQLGLDPNVWARAVGDLVAQSWQSAVDLPDFARYMALNQRGFGAQVTGLRSDADTAEIALAWPPPALLYYFGLSQADVVEPLMLIGASLAERLGYTFSWSLTAGVIQMRYARA